MSPWQHLSQRQVWAKPTAGSGAIAAHCTPIALPASAVLTLDDTSTITLASKAFLLPECTTAAQIPYSLPSNDTSSIADLHVPFYASAIPQIYAIATATVISYMLLIMLVITPRTFYVGGASGGGGILGQQGMIGGSSGRTSVVGIGGRPWLQKVAALTVVISLTVASANTFKIVKEQYLFGYIDASALGADVVGGLEVRIVRVISDAFLWLAQVQTLIRLFPRHKEKVIIKWAGFALIILDTIFAILNTFFVNSSKTKPRTFVDAIPALAYLFQLALSLLYAAWVIYYSCSKRRFAFYHPKMRNICLVAVLALAAVLIPVVFFVLDISKPNVAGWGDYFRWVGAAAASVVVWEWVERIETLERDEKKDGILGREVFDGDEMLEATTSQRVQWLGSADGRGRGNRGDTDLSSRSTGNCVLTGTTSNSRRTPHVSQQLNEDGLLHIGRGSLGRHSRGRISVVTSPTNQDPSQSFLAPPPPAVTPASRSDTTSAASTEYAVQYHPMSHLSPPIAGQLSSRISASSPNSAQQQGGIPEIECTARGMDRSGMQPNLVRAAERAPTTTEPGIRPLPRWQAMSNPFKRRRASLPRELASATAVERRPTALDTSSPPLSITDRWQTRPKRGIRFMAKQVERKGTGSNERERQKPIVVVPAQPRGRTWSPETSESVPLGIAVLRRGSPAVPPPPGETESIKIEADNSDYLIRQGRDENPLPDGLHRGNSANPADVWDGQILSQRGSLLISEARHWSGSPRAPSQTANCQNYHYRTNEQSSSRPVEPPSTPSQTGTPIRDHWTQNGLSLTGLNTRPSAQNGHSFVSEPSVGTGDDTNPGEIHPQQNAPTFSSPPLTSSMMQSQPAIINLDSRSSWNTEPTPKDISNHDPGG